MSEETIYGIDIGHEDNTSFAVLVDGLVEFVLFGKNALTMACLIEEKDKHLAAAQARIAELEELCAERVSEFGQLQTALEKIVELEAQNKAMREVLEKIIMIDRIFDVPFLGEDGQCCHRDGESCKIARQALAAIRKETL